MLYNFDKKIGFWGLTALVVGNMMGASIFILPANLAKIGVASLLSWGITACGAFLFALVFSKMSRIVTAPGGPYAYAHAMFGKFAGFQVAYNYWASLWIGNAALAIAMMGYLAVYAPIASHPIYGTLIAILAIWLLTIINMADMKWVFRVQIIATVIKLIPLLIVAILGWKYFTGSYFVTDALSFTNANTWLDIKDGVSLTLWAFIGIESATVIPAEKIKNSMRNVPLATLIGTLIAAVFYISSSIVVVGMIPELTLSASISPFAEALTMIFGSWGGALVAICAAISCLGCINGRMLLQNQVAKAAADDGVLPAMFKICNRKGTPIFNQLLTSTLISLLLYFATQPELHDHFQIITLVALFAALIPYLFTSSAEVMAIRRMTSGDYGWKDRMHLLFALLAMVYAFVILCICGSDIIYYGAILLLSSIPLYVL